MHIAVWFCLAAVVLVLVALDLRSARHQRPVSVRRAAVESAGWLAAGLAFALVVLVSAGGQAATSYLTVFGLEKALSLDNVAVLAVVVAALGLATPAEKHLVTAGL